ncbi:MAG: AAA family ATPase [Candidatus Thermoplasmatota archaeon]|nr:AAA family ATPase [Candidatus Thermoplasmatota archaeon]
MNLKIAISGKGGVGKSTLAVLLAKELAKKGKVLLLDADPVPTTSKLLGIKQEIEPLARMTELIDERTGVDLTRKFFKLNPKVDDLVDRVGVDWSENLKLLVLGTIDTTKAGCFCPENAFLKAFLRHLTKTEGFVILDMEAGIEHLTRGTTQNVDLLIVVIEPSLRAVEVASAIARQAENIGLRKEKIIAVLNKYRDEQEAQKAKELLEKSDIHLVAAIPYDEKIAHSEKEGLSLSYEPSTDKESKKLADICTQFQKG